MSEGGYQLTWLGKLTILSLLSGAVAYGMVKYDNCSHKREQIALNQTYQSQALKTNLDSKNFMEIKQKAEKKVSDTSDYSDYSNSFVNITSPNDANKGVIWGQYDSSGNIIIQSPQK